MNGWYLRYFWIDREEKKVVGVAVCYIRSDIKCLPSAKLQLPTTEWRWGVNKHRLSVRLALQVSITLLCHFDR